MLLPSKTVLGIDMGFRSIGLAVQSFDPNTGKWRVLDMRLVSTEETAKLHKKQKHLRQSAQVFVRAAEAAAEVDSAILLWRPTLVCYEDTMWVRGTKAMFRVGNAYGFLAHMLVNQHKLPSIPVQPLEAKQAVCGKLATKEERQKADVVKAVRKRFPECTALTKHLTDDQCAHPHDAVAIIEACKGDPVFKLAMGC